MRLMPGSSAPSPTPRVQPTNRRVERWLYGGLVTGAVAAITGLLLPAPSPGPASPDIRAVVNGTAITTEEYEQMAALLDRAAGQAAAGSDRRSEHGSPETDRVLDRLIEEELLFQRALELDLPAQEPQLRAAILRVMVDWTLADVRSEQPTLDDLRTYYQEHGEEIVPASHLALSALHFDDDGRTPPVPAYEGLQALSAGASFDSLKANRAAQPSELLSGLQPLDAWAPSLGETAVSELARSQSGETVGPIRTPIGWLILRVDERRVDTLPELDLVRREVTRAYERQRDDEAYRRYVTNLRERAEIRILPPADPKKTPAP